MYWISCRVWRLRPTCRNQSCCDIIKVSLSSKTAVLFFLARFHASLIGPLKTERKRFGILSRWSWTGCVTFRNKSTSTSCLINREGVTTAIHGCNHEKNLPNKQWNQLWKEQQKQIGRSAIIRKSRPVKRNRETVDEKTSYREVAQISVHE